MDDDQNRLQRASSMLIHAACLSAESGATREYFEKWHAGAKGEAHRRQQFFELRKELQSSPSTSLENAVRHFGKLNGEYGTRFDREHHNLACETIVSLIPESAWSVCLFDLLDEQVAEHAKIVSNALRPIGAGAKKRPYSLATKYLHFLLPDLFVIYDSQAAMSIWMWSLFAYGEDQPEIKALAIANLSSTDGDGYVELMRFYHRVWHSTGPELRDRARNASQSLESLLSSVPGCKEARISVLDLIDKHLWKCNGDPIRLGLAMPP